MLCIHQAGQSKHSRTLHRTRGVPFPLFDGPASSNDHIAYITTENLASITFDITQSAGSGSLGFKIIAPIPEPSTASLCLRARQVASAPAMVVV